MTDENVTIFPKFYMPEEATREDLIQDLHNIFLSRLCTLKAEVVSLREEPVLNKQQYSALRSLITYASNDKGIMEDVILDMICKRFSVSDVKNLHSTDYDRAVQYIIHLDIQSALQ